MPWRPDGWKNPYKVAEDEANSFYESYREAAPNIDVQFGMLSLAYETGADAMLKAQMDMARKSPTGTFVIDSHSVQVLAVNKESEYKLPPPCNPCPPLKLTRVEDGRLFCSVCGWQAEEDCDED